MFENRQTVPTSDPYTDPPDGDVDHAGISTEITANAAEYNMTDATDGIAKLAIRYDNGVNRHLSGLELAQHREMLARAKFARICNTWCQELERAVGEMETMRRQKKTCPRQFETWVGECLSRLSQQATRILNQTIGEPDLLDRLKILSSDSSLGGYRCTLDGDDCPANR